MKREKCKRKVRRVKGCVFKIFQSRVFWDIPLPYWAADQQSGVWTNELWATLICSGNNTRPYAVEL